MFETFSALDLARFQFAFTISAHIIFPAFTIGLASFLAVLNALWLWKGDPVYLRLFDYWKTIFAVVFGMGVVSGIVMSYLFGTNWSVFSLRSSGATTGTAAKLCEGFYTVTVTDISGCTGTTSAEVKGKTTNVLATITNQTIPKCGTPCIGKLKVNGSGGTQYSYIWSTNPAKTAQTISNICPGT